MELLGDPSPLVRGAAIWALSRLMEAGDFAALRDERLAAEIDPQAADEWRTAKPTLSAPDKDAPPIPG
jgi:epoxyqueuosine reductase